MKKMLLLLAIMVSATLLATAQVKLKKEVRTYIVSEGDKVVKKPPIASNCCGGRKTTTSNSNSSSVPAWKRAQEENEKRNEKEFIGIKKDIDEIQEDISALRNNNAVLNYRLGVVETQTQYLLSQNLSNAQLLQRGVENKENTSTSLDLERERKKNRIQGTVIGVVLVALASAGVYALCKSAARNSNQPALPTNQTQNGNSDPGSSPPAPSGE